jgi:ESCRT-II complex subunit VPS25
MSFEFPAFFSYPPYFTLQPVKDTKDRQSKLWGELIHAYCRHAKVFIVDVESDAFPLWSNPSISRKLPLDARRIFLDDLVLSGGAEWLDKSKRVCLILWKRIQEWSAMIYTFVLTFGLRDSVMTLTELSSGDDTRGTGKRHPLDRGCSSIRLSDLSDCAEIYGIHREVLIRALRLLETQGKAR